VPLPMGTTGGFGAPPQVGFGGATFINPLGF
jgi:hypothetical protein